MWSLIPRRASFFDDLERLSRHIANAARLLYDLVHDFTDVTARVGAIKDVEHQGDQVTHEIVSRLNSTFVTPIDREDAYALAGRLDDVLDYIEAAAAALLVYRVKQTTSECRAMAAVIIEAVAAMDAAVRCLRTLDPTFSGHALEVHRQEHSADRLLRTSLAALFHEAADPLDVLRWKDIYDTMEGVTDRCEDVVNVIEAIRIKMA